MLSLASAQNLFLAVLIVNGILKISGSYHFGEGTLSARLWTSHEDLLGTGNSAILAAISNLREGKSRTQLHFFWFNRSFLRTR